MSPRALRPLSASLLAPVAVLLLSASGCGGSSAGLGNPDMGHPPDMRVVPKVYLPAASSSGTPEDGLTQLNKYRGQMGLGSVGGNNDAPFDCEGHLDYLIEESLRQGQCYLEHSENNHSNSHYSAENEMAGLNSVIACGSGGFSLAQAVDLWINSLYHRLPLIEPGLRVVGYAAKQGYACINYRPGTSMQRAKAPVVWPADGMTGVPTQFAGNEGPCPTNIGGGSCPRSGFIVTASWSGWGDFTDASTVELIDTQSGESVELLDWYGDGVEGHDPLPGYIAGSIALVPVNALAGNRTYRLNIKATIGGADQTLSTTFTTGSRNL